MSSLSKILNTFDANGFNEFSCIVESHFIFDMPIFMVINFSKFSRVFRVSSKKLYLFSSNKLCRSRSSMSWLGRPVSW